MPEAFTASFSASLNKASQLTVQECNDVIDLQPGLALVAHGGRHMILSKKIGGYRALSRPGEKVCHQCPSVEVLFHSVAETVGPDSIGVILTGMGRDGAEGLLAMRNAGAITIAQDEESCVVFGMPKEAIELNAAREILPLDKIPQAIISAVHAKVKHRTVSTS